MTYKVIDLFAGVGGFSLGFEMAGFKIVFANEHDASIANAYNINHKGTEVIVSDIQDLNIEKVFSKFKNKISVVIGGPPCQGFSQKGQRKSINDERNFLFKHFVNIVSYIKPAYFVMENVPNLLTAENGYFKAELNMLFNNLGYNVSAKIINAADYGVPQNRRRAIIIGKLNGQAPEIPVIIRKKVTIWDAISDLAYLNSGEGSDTSDYKYPPQSEYQIKLRKHNELLYNHRATKHSELAIERLKLIPPNKGKEVLPKEHHTKSIYSGTWTRMNKDDVSVTITTRFDTPSSGKFTHPYLNRAITVREAARIQSFPDSYIFTGTKGSQMKQVGNAVPPVVGKTIAEIILNNIKESENGL